MNNFVKGSLIFFFIVIIFTCFGCTRNNEKTVKLGCINSYGAMQLYIAKEEGYFKKEGISVEIVKFRTSNLVAEAVFNNQIDVGVMISSLPYFTLAANDDTKFKIYNAAMTTKAFSVCKVIASVKSNIHSIKDLKGKTIGLLPGVAQKTNCRIAMESTFGKNIEYTTVPMPPNTHIEALASGRVDAVFSIEPIPTIGKLKGLTRNIGGDALTDFVLESYPGGVSAISTQFLEENPVLSKKILYILYKSQEFADANNETARKYLAKNMDLDEKIIIKMETTSNRVLRHEQFDYSTMQPILEFYAKEGLIKKSFPIESICLDKSFKVN